MVAEWYKYADDFGAYTESEKFAPKFGVIDRVKGFRKIHKQGENFSHRLANLDLYLRISCKNIIKAASYFSETRLNSGRR